MKLIVANWKMQIGLSASVDLAKAMAKYSSHHPPTPPRRGGETLDREDVSVVLCPSFTVLDAVGSVLGNSPVALGAQNVFWQMVGAHTGEISPLHLGELGVSFVIIGHSERRVLGETDAEINKKVIAVLSAGLTPIICVGETKAERKAGKTSAVIVAQVKAAIKGLHTRAKEQLVFAYEPVWAIGSGTPASPTDTAVVHSLIRSTVIKTIAGIKPKQLRVIYGGSVDTKNAEGFLREKEIDGLLIGGASLEVASLQAIIDLC